MKPAQAKKTRAAIREFALSLPGAYEDFPWEESVAKVNKKVFCFLGVADPAQYPLGMTVKIPELAALVTSMEACEPSGYGLGKAGWVTVSFAKDDCPALDVLRDWVEESYRVIAPKKLVKELDA